MIDRMPACCGEHW